ncbi:MAG: hypothetical protein ACK5KP_10770 [Paludibacteraceae bacterium]
MIIYFASQHTDWKPARAGNVCSAEQYAPIRVYRLALLLLPGKPQIANLR